MEIKRQKYLDMLVTRKHNGFIKVITGIRRCGKSYLLNNLFSDDLIKSGVDNSHIIKFAFDSADDLIKIDADLEVLANNKKVDAKKFIEYIYSKILDDKMYYILLDEVQNLNCFESVLNGFSRKPNLDIYVTGSNSKFLSHDVLTEFEGRGDEIHVLPLSFSEYTSALASPSDYDLDEYMIYGGLPAVVKMQTDEQKINYLQTQIKNV